MVLRVRPSSLWSQIGKIAEKVLVTHDYIAVARGKIGADAEGTN